jgi:hypothetical protein
MVQSTDRSGKARVTAQADGFQPVSVDVTVVPGRAPAALP